ncbi:MAG: glycoside hydrolase family 3 C-terminal domain-containing protein [Saccharospirillaceae bacterium]|nr:glycoside hydrolase family 3 C-terminal domain-containing protein [Pseudomonadales bacterium]NRB79506.1 glycoside hydrolase family 3 C-terminal domain-containing protein [Saccharospirillaceae bacterium]
MFDVKDVLAKLSIQEKISLLCGDQTWQLTGFEKHNVPSIILTDGPHGVRLEDKSATTPFTFLPATVYPAEAAMAATFNTDLIHQVGQSIAKECHFYNVSVLLGPGVNGKRSPLAGRNFEYYSEDPYLSGHIAAAFINGVQSEGVGTSLKHFAGNEQETRRFLINSVISQRALHEIYLRPFEIAVKQANPWTLMGAYNAVNGSPACQNSYLLQDVLREQWQYEGAVMSDWGATRDKLEAHNNGLDFEMPGPGKQNEFLFEQFKLGNISQQTIDTRALNVLNLIKKATEGKQQITKINWQQHNKLSEQVAKESIVLLKNDNHCLPLSKNINVAVIGQFAKDSRFQGGGSSSMTAKMVTHALPELEKVANITFAQGYIEENVTTTQLAEAVAACKNKDAVILFVGTTDAIETEGFDRTDLLLPKDHLKLIDAVLEANSNTIIVLNCGSVVDLQSFVNKTPAIVMNWFNGQASGSAITDMLFGKISPSGKLSESFPICLEHNPSFDCFPGGKNDVEYKEETLVGYRYYDTKKLPVQFPFGHGLSYSNFEYSDLEIDITQNSVTVTVKNTGQIQAKETIQIYIHPIKSYLLRPEQELKGFVKTDLAPNESKTVTIVLCDRAFEHYVPHLNRYACEAGLYEIRASSSSRDIRLTQTVNIQSNDPVKIKPTQKDTVFEWFEDERTFADIDELLKLLEIQPGHFFWGILKSLPIEHAMQMINNMTLSDEIRAKCKEIISRHD